MHVTQNGPEILTILGEVLVHLLFLLKSLIASKLISTQVSQGHH